MRFNFSPTVLHVNKLEMAYTVLSLQINNHNCFVWMNAKLDARNFEKYLTIILRNRAEYRLILSRRGRRPRRLKSDDIPRD